MNLEETLKALVAEHGEELVFETYRSVIGCECAYATEDEGLSHHWTCPRTSRDDDEHEAEDEDSDEE